MAKIAKNGPPLAGPLLTPSPQALKKALCDGARNAQRVAQAFGVKFPVATPRRSAVR